MKNIAIVLAMISMMVGCVAETGEPEVETLDGETTYEEEGALATEGENIGTSTDELMRSDYDACMHYCTSGGGDFGTCHETCKELHARDMEGSAL